MRQLALIAALLTGCVTTRLASPTSDDVQAATDLAVIETGGTATYVVIVKDTHGGRLEQPSFGGLAALGPERFISETLTVENGTPKSTKRGTFVWKLTAPASTTYTIGPARLVFGGHVLESNSVEVTCAAGATAAPMTVNAEVLPPDSDIGKQVLYRIHVTGPRDHKVDPPAFGDLAAQSAKPFTLYRIDGTTHRAVTTTTYPWTLTPPRLGHYVLTGAHVTAQGRTVDVAPATLDCIHEDGKPLESQSFLILRPSSTAARLEPARLEASISKTTLNVGDEAKYVLTIWNGADGSLTPPEFGDLQVIAKGPGASEMSLSISNGVQVVNRKTTFWWTVRARSAGPRVIGPARLHFGTTVIESPSLELQINE